MGKQILPILIVGFMLVTCNPSSSDDNNSTGNNNTPSETCGECYTTQGACSHHNGVNCSAGADDDGSVICNDGWRDSSVSYSCN